MHRLALLALLGLLSLVACSSVVGIHPSVASHYAGARFTCLDGSKTIDASRINDDYCDCADASDEPGTSACANGKFWCRNRGHIGKFIPSSMVFDGICDCCDASDEVPGFCSAICESEGKAQKLEMQKQLRAIREGLRVRNRWEEESLDRYNSEVVQRIHDIKSEIQALNEKVDEKKALVDAMEQLYHEADKALNPELEAAGESGDEPIDEGAKEYIAAAQIDEAIALFRAKHGRSPNDVIQDYKAAEDRYKTAKKEVEEHSSEVQKLEEITKLDLNSGKFYKHYGEVLTYSTSEYTYSLKFFDEVRQGSYRLGTFSAWDGSDYKVMKYTHGQYCWGGPDRSTTVKLVCGASNEIKSIEEPAKCEYLMVLVTPYACSAEEAKELELSLQASSLDEHSEIL